MRALDSDYTAQYDGIREDTWNELLQEFDDASIYQTWPYAEVIAGPGRCSRLVVRRNGIVVALAQVRITKAPILRTGVAYVQWGPVWQRHGASREPNHLRQALRALHNEFLGKRRVGLQIFPLLTDADEAAEILAEEGFARNAGAPCNRTILMDVTPTLEMLREGMQPHWKRELKTAEGKRLDVVEGEQAELFDEFISIYKEMVARKRFVEPNDISQFRSIQERLPSALKMRILLCRSNHGTCAGIICSNIGTMAMYLFGATSNEGMKSRGSYLLQWKILAYLKQAGCLIYNLNGINPAVNPGTYKFKSDLAGTHGEEVTYTGRFHAYPSRFCAWSVNVGYKMLHAARQMKSARKHFAAERALQ